MNLFASMKFVIRASIRDSTRAHWRLKRGWREDVWRQSLSNLTCVPLMDATVKRIMEEKQRNWLRCNVCVKTIGGRAHFLLTNKRVGNLKSVNTLHDTTERPQCYVLRFTPTHEYNHSHECMLHPSMIRITPRIGLRNIFMLHKLYLQCLEMGLICRTEKAWPLFPK